MLQKYTKKELKKLIIALSILAICFFLLMITCLFVSYEQDKDLQEYKQAYNISISNLEYCYFDYAMLYYEVTGETNVSQEQIAQVILDYNLTENILEMAKEDLK